MTTSVYGDLIEGKVAEWKKRLGWLEKQAESVGNDEIQASFEKARINTQGAITRLYELDKAETAENTMETKEEILEIFSSIDKELPQNEHKSPFML